MEKKEVNEAKINFIQTREIVRKQRPLSAKRASSNWTERIQGTLGIIRNNSPIDACIFRVPKELRKVERGAYSPHIVSIGPLHQDEHDLLAMEEHKWRYMLSLVQQTPDGLDKHDTLDKCRDIILQREKEARGSYAENIKFNKHELAEIMLVDGCFILGLFLKSWDIKSGRAGNGTDGDLIFGNAWMVPTLQHDLLLLENQIPFFVLDDLFTIFKPHVATFQSCEIIDLAFSFFKEKTNQKATLEGGSRDVRHLLDLLHKSYFPPDPTFPNHKDSKLGKETGGFRDYATKLLEAGMEFKKGTGNNLLNIRFTSGAITIPPLHINEFMESLLKNLIAFEQCRLGSTHYATSYAFLIKSLIHSSRDIDLLQQKGILTNELGRGVKDVLALFNNISREVVLKEFYFGELCRSVNEQQNSCCYRYGHKAFWLVWGRRQLDSLKSNYFRNAWRGMSVIAAVVLLILTALQTVYTIITFYA